MSARDLAGNLSSPQVYHWEIDTTPPSLRIVEAPNTYTNQTTSTFKFFAMDTNVQQVFECSLDGAAFQSCPSPLNLSTSEGLHNLRVRTIDLVGNISSPLSHEWTVDLTPPIVQITSTPRHLINEREATFTFVVTDESSGVKSIHCSLNGVPSACLSPTIYKNLVEDLNSFAIYAIDKANNISEPLEYQWLVDLTPPEMRWDKNTQSYSRSK